jgi:hypothetical protein
MISSQSKNPVYSIYKIIFITFLLLAIFAGSSSAVSLPFSLTWDRNSESDLAFYTVYHGTSSLEYNHFGEPDPPNTYFTFDASYFASKGISIGPDGLDIYVAVTATDYSLNESGYSEELVVHIDPPPATTTTPSTTTTPATTTTPVTQHEIIIEAEEMQVHDNGEQDGEYWLLWGNGTMNEDVYFPDTDTYHSKVIAKADLAFNVGPEMELLIDGKSVSKVIVNTTTPETFDFDVEISEGLHTVAIGFSNDYWDPSAGLDRNLYVDKIKIRSSNTTTSIPSPTTTTSIPSPTTTTSIPSPTTTTSMRPDLMPPVGTISINQGAATTDCQIVTLYLSAQDDESGMGEGAQMMFSKHDKQQWSDPMPFEAEKQWTLSPGKGERTIYAKFSDAAGNWMDEPVSDSIVLSSSCPNPRKLNVSALESSSAFPSRLSERKIVDGNTNTGWLSPLRLSQRDESITIDLAEMKTVNRVDISSNLLRQFDLFPHDFEVQASTDNANWVNLFTVENYYPPPSRSESWTFEEIETRYIRMVITRSKRLFMFFYAAYIADIAVYGCTETESPELALSTSPDQTDASEIERILSLQSADTKLRINGMLPGSKLRKRNTANAGSRLTNDSFDPLNESDHIYECEASGVTCDNGSTFTSFSGIWDESDKPDSYGSSSLISRESGTHTWTPDLLKEGYYQLYMWWSSSMANCSSCPVEISCDGGLIDTLYLNQQQDGGQWNLLGPYDLEKGNACSVTILSGDSSLNTCADAVRFVYMEESLPEARINFIYPDPSAVEEEVCFEGYGIPGDGMSIEGYIWRSNLDGVLSTSDSFCTSSLSEGMHHISFTVEDDEALCSVAAETMLSVGLEAE